MMDSPSTAPAEPDASTAAIRLARLETDADLARWDAFVDRHPEATFFHRAGWKQVLEQGLGHRAPFLYAERDGELCGILPLGEIRSLLFGRALISTPFCVYGGAVADDPEVRGLLETEACRLAETAGVGHLELREREPHHPDWPGKALYATFRRAIDPDPERNLQQIPRKQRAMVRKGIKAGLSSRFDDGVDALYRVYSESVRNLGTPVFPRRYFRVLKQVFGDDCEVLLVEHQGALVSGVMSFRFRDEVLPYYGGGTQAARALKANDFMYWEVMRRACVEGVRTFDFGRSKRGTGAFDFKRNWGFEPEPLHYAYRLVRANELPDVNPLNPKYRLFIAAWKRLPLPLSQLIGPLLARNLG
ncbi:FemAB family XrtA/PEP-CTERM system-associated protein [Marichromatium purpuratum]|nr:FemAB family XrtA/PEP-CTERM system-associated protein [Marichromatium purpuratum]